MDKVTQAMLAYKVDSLAPNFKGDVDEKFLTTQEKESHLKEREKSINEMEASRLQQQKDIALHHQQRNNEREEMRNNIRNKYQLKGSPGYTGSYYTNHNKIDTGKPNSGEIKLRSSRFKKCSVQ